MSNIVLRVRNYPWQWSEDFAKAYTLEELKDPVKLKYTGGSLIEIHQEFYINAIKKQVKDFFYPLAKNVRNDPLTMLYTAIPMLCLKIIRVNILR